SGILKGRTYEERVGLEKAAKIKKQISRTLTGHKSHRKGLTMEKEYGEKKAGEIKNCIGINTSKAMQNPTVKRKLKIIFLKRKKQNYDIYFPNYNPHACEFFKSYDEQHGTKGQFAMYGGGEYYIDELNYWVDYFNPEIKLIMEYDEPYHYDKNGNLNKKDIQRQNEIQALFPDFKFERIKEELI
ncbi:MAG: hypothetical protein NT162_02435, partial [Candidatus Woesebacteria bacterium]|nr:hypothetical protein [Candidatus Woesebacteria bacterium]